MGHPEGLADRGLETLPGPEIEASQEAGVKGVISKEPAGIYPYSKALPDGESRIRLVAVFPLRAMLEKATWPKSAERQRQWFGLDEAAEMIDEASLAQIIGAGGRPRLSKTPWRVAVKLVAS